MINDNGIKLASGFHLISDGWNFTRDSFHNLSDLKDYTLNYSVPEGFMTYVEEEKCRYVYNNNNPDTQQSGKWKRVDFNQLENDIKVNNDSINSINTILNNRFPFTLTSFGINKSISEIGNTEAITANWKYDGILDNPTGQSIFINDVETIIPSNTTRSYGPINVTKNTSFKLKFNQTNYSNTVLINFVLPKYFGVIDKEPTLETDITTLLTKTTLSSSKSYTSPEINPNFQYVCYAYPLSYGKLTKITDITGKDDSINVFSYKTIKINNIDYYVYYANIYVQKYKYVFS